MMILGNVTTLIFDLGGVLLNLSFEATYKAFADLSGKSVSQISDFAKTREEFIQYEKGLLTDAEFREFLRRELVVNATDEQLDVAWNAMLLDFPAKRFHVLRELRKHYSVFLLSNTNAIHARFFEKQAEDTIGVGNFASYFDKVYYSHELKMRKPDTEIFNHVLIDNSLSAEKTVFFDDVATNIDGAARVGLKTYLVQSADELFEKLDERK